MGQLPALITDDVVPVTLLHGESGDDGIDLEL